MALSVAGTDPDWMILLFFSLLHFLLLLIFQISKASCTPGSGGKCRKAFDSEGETFLLRQMGNKHLTALEKTEVYQVRSRSWDRRRDCLDVKEEKHNIPLPQTCHCQGLGGSSWLKPTWGFPSFRKLPGLMVFILALSVHVTFL